MEKYLANLLSLKFLVYLVLALAGLIILVRGKALKTSRLVALGGSFFLLGGVVGLLVTALKGPLGMHPSPMCALTKLIGFGYLKGTFPVPLVVMLIVIVVLSLVARKLFCGWICPLGALQELLYMIPGVPKLRNLSFRVTNSVRTALFAAYFVGLFGFGIILYEQFSINGFETLHWQLTLGLGLLLAAIVAGSLFYYRPYCYLVCPIGLMSWVLERFTLLGLRLNRERCTDCRLCAAKAPCPAMEAILDERTVVPDCTSCGLCIPICPENALSYGVAPGLAPTVERMDDETREGAS